MKILLIAGHGAGDSGALGNGYREADLTRELVGLIAPKLRGDGVTVAVRDITRNAYADAQNGTLDVLGYDYVFEVHFNAFNDAAAHGTEIYVTTLEKEVTVEANVLKALGKYFTVRGGGVKVTNFSVITTAKNQGVSSALVETCFITNKADMDKYQANKVAIANDIAQAIRAGFGVSATAPAEKPPVVEAPKPSTPPTGATIVVGSKVQPKTTTDYNGTHLAAFVTQNVYQVVEVKGDRVVLAQINTAFKMSDLKLVADGGSAPTPTPTPTPTPSQPTIKRTHARVNRAVSYDGVGLISSIVGKEYPVIEIRGNRIVLGGGLNTAFNVADITYTR
ncbi:MULTISPECIES: N-acetylmuramoyl-L-alanine amidase [unclassified Breznakia]|uniref:N-acetylmuramoyl-L-alanine amidase n=1 Tax=unclassified Breznakia TaxID=2623764 RepID=UPI0024734540|nr:MULTISPECIES: N-acetylmuramoyl-L-alanine amidase [unclassified Breznakia]MDH6367569.1 hypothetical protein [Breznakia sp. PH1-1]MDH6404637.1 hypothetical protein [Breznakia sp. PF1-11]MDH6412399.1 hypothetical protein [Breznakia sp. PFB1-11]MDH6414737.1 hypothetical protein [Breznakia sp. PFB1-14]MDH6417018.1 hypothetical protein [Breznakia sp. PFB1-4]